MEWTIDAVSVARAEQMMRNYPRRLAAALYRAMVNSTADILTKLKEKVPVGKQPGGQHGNLRRSWVLKKPEQAEDGVGWIGGMGSTAPYAAAVEFGKHNPESVRGHQRRVFSRTSFQRTASGRVRQFHGKARGVQLGAVWVRAHTRLANMPAQPYARPALSEGVTDVVKHHEAAINEVWNELYGGGNVS